MTLYVLQDLSAVFWHGCITFMPEGGKRWRQILEVANPREERTTSQFNLALEILVTATNTRTLSQS